MTIPDGMRVTVQANLPENEQDRLNALRRYEVLDTEAESSFDRMTDLACYICNTPISAISLVDENRQWFKSIAGLDAKETHRDVAFCAHAILQPDAFIVADATKDPRFADNPLVTSPPDIRFYAGIPLVTSDGYALGTLCVIDTVPRQIGAEQINALKTLADQTMTQLELRRSVKQTKGYIDALKLAEMVYHNSSDGMMVSDADNHVIAINPAFSKLTGYGLEDAVGKNPSFLKSGRQSPDFYRQMWDVLQRTGVWQGEIWNRRKNGDVYAELLTINIIRNTDGSVFRHVALFSDITEKKQAEEKLLSHREELARSNAELEQFAYVASHDLRQPLRTVSSFLSLLEKSALDKLNDEERKYMRFASDGALRMHQMVSDLLTYSRIGRGERAPTPFDLSGIVDEAVAGLKTAIDECQGRIVIENALPTVLGDRGELVRLFQNLIGNAIKYRRPEHSPVIEISSKLDGDICAISIKDNGIGIAPEDVDKIFGLFQRLHGAGEFEGTGIGLAVCKKIADYHGGGIDVTSVPDHGSTFTVTLKSPLLCAA